MTGVVTITSNNRPVMYGTVLASLSCIELYKHSYHSAAKKKKKKKEVLKLGLKPTTYYIVGYFFFFF